MELLSKKRNRSCLHRYAQKKITAIVVFTISYDIPFSHQIIVPVCYIPKLNGFDMPMLSLKMELIQNSRNRLGLHIFGKLNILTIGHVSLSPAKNTVSSTSQIRITGYCRTIIIDTIHSFHIQGPYGKGNNGLLIGRMNIRCRYILNPAISAKSCFITFRNKKIRSGRCR